MRFILGLFLTVWLSVSAQSQEGKNHVEIKEKSSYKIGIIIGSTRPNKIGGDVAQWVFNHVQKTPNLTFTLVDLEKWNLPLFNEPSMPANGPETYVQDHTKKWSQEIASYDGFIFVTPQYNSGYPASLKNAIDYLFVEWKEKPAMIVSYGFQAGGVKSAAQLKQVLESMKMKISSTMPAIGLSGDLFDEKRKLKNPEEDFKTYEESVAVAVNELSDNLSIKQ